MKKRVTISEPNSGSLPKILTWMIIGMVILGVLAVMPGVWALPEQSPDFQTLPTLTPTPTPRGATATPTRPGATATPTQPAATITPTRPGEPTDTPVPGATPTNTPTIGTPTQAPGTGTPTVTATSAPTNSTPTRVGATPTQGKPAACWTVPTPGFDQVRVAGLAFEAASDQSLVVPGQTFSFRLTATNRGKETIAEVRICDPIDPTLSRGKPVTSQGNASLVPEGLIAELGALAPGDTATVEMPLTIPADFPLGGVIENQAWLFANGQQASTSLQTWALPPAYLPPTGN
jgi:uncharacterized repeat protein (TIGR01451 family)